jgi:hypothetical protein
MIKVRRFMFWALSWSTRTESYKIYEHPHGHRPYESDVVNLRFNDHYATGCLKTVVEFACMVGIIIRSLMLTCAGREAIQ